MMKKRRHKKGFKEEDIFKKAADIIGSHTPIYADCGLLCDKSCCKGDGDTGMLLFPGEETGLPVKEKDGVRLCVCGGSCSRQQRPLSCRIFPFFPYITPEGKIRAAIDIRGRGICPLVDYYSSVSFSPAFLRSVSRVGRLLKRDRACREFLYETSRELDKLSLFYK